MFLHFLRRSDKKNLCQRYFFLTTLVVLFSPLSWTATFRTDYVSLEIPSNWKCQKMLSITHVCHNKDKKKSKEFVIILTAKEVGSQDNLSEYEGYLKQRKIPQVRKPKEKVEPSKVINVSKRNISSHPWVDGFHMGSEFQKYYTRYLVSTEKKVAVLVTYTVHQQKWKQYSSFILKSIQSLKILSMESTLRKIRASNPEQESEKLANYLAGIFGDGDIDFEEDSSSSFLDSLLKDHLLETTAGGIAGGGLLYFLYKRLRRKKGPSAKSSSSRRRRRRR